MRRTIILTLTAGLMLWGAPAVLAQGPPAHAPARGQEQLQNPSDERPEPPAEDGTGPQQPSGQGQKQAEYNAPSLNPVAQQQHAGKNDAGTATEPPAPGMQQSSDGRERASEVSGLNVPVNEEARELGREFGQERATSVREPVGRPETATAATGRGRGPVGPPETAAAVAPAQTATAVVGPAETATVATENARGPVAEVFQRIRDFLATLFGGRSENG